MFELRLKRTEYFIRHNYNHFMEHKKLLDSIWKDSQIVARCDQHSTGKFKIRH